MVLTGVHLLLTYTCTYECDHCFVWSSPGQSGVITLPKLAELLAQSRDLGTVKWFYFEGGEPFLYPGILRWGARRARELGFRVGVVSNAYWAIGPDEAYECLRDYKGLIEDLSISCDTYHGNAEQEVRARHATAAAKRLGIPAGVIRIAPVTSDAARRVGQLPEDESVVMFRGRAAERLAPQAPRARWDTFTSCPFEDLREPGRVHVDPLGWVHVCQGIAIGNVFRTPLREICRDYRPETHPIVGPVLAGGPAELARRYRVPREETCADACHLCYRTREALRLRFPEALAPAQMYGGPASA